MQFLLGQAQSFLLALQLNQEFQLFIHFQLLIHLLLLLCCLTMMRFLNIANSHYIGGNPDVIQRNVGKAEFLRGEYGLRMVDDGPLNL